MTDDSIFQSPDDVPYLDDEDHERIVLKSTELIEQYPDAAYALAMVGSALRDALKQAEPLFGATTPDEWAFDLERQFLTYYIAALATCLLAERKAHAYTKGEQSEQRVLDAQGRPFKR